MPEIVKLLFKDSLVSAELDNGEVLNLSYDAYSQYKLSSGMVIQGDLYSELYEESRKTECRDKAFKYLAVRSRSVDEMEKYLRKKKFSESQVAETSGYLNDKGYLDDYEFSRGFVKSKMKSGKYGADIIIRDLYRKGIHRKTIEKIMKECGAAEPDMEKLYELALKKYNSLKEKDNRSARVGNYLRSKGFDYDSIKKVLRRLGEEDL
ncbi:MAG TPA: regulatory protein RecX [Spirochaetota bacterium]|nr:regulatory protein RecX [Spirochaetota bacterium]